MAYGHSRCPWRDAQWHLGISWQTQQVNIHRCSLHNTDLWFCICHAKSCRSARSAPALHPPRGIPRHPRPKPRGRVTSKRVGRSTASPGRRSSGPLGSDEKCGHSAMALRCTDYILIYFNDLRNLRAAPCVKQLRKKQKKAPKTGWLQNAWS